MTEVIKKEIELDNGTILFTYNEEITSACIMEVEAGTNGYKGGDTGHGSRTYFRIEDLGGTDITVNKIPNNHGGNGGLEVILGGDCELQSMIEALKFITQVLEDGANDRNY